MNQHETSSFFDRLKRGLEEGIAHSRGELKLKTTTRVAATRRNRQAGKIDTDYEQISVFKQVKTGLEQAIAHGHGELTLKTTTLPLPPPAAPKSSPCAKS